MNEVEKGTLYVVGTPIGNLEELSPRAVKTLSDVDLFLCEDCRRTLGLLNAFGIAKPLRAHHKFNEKATVDGITAELSSGKSVALVSDAGMPCVSDPGHLLVEACRERGIPVSVVSGPCAAVDALVLSGLDSTRFCFVGFLPERTRDRKKLLQDFSRVPATLIFYIAPHRLNEDLADLYFGLGARQAALVREITKLHEETVKFTLCEKPDFVPRGEYVVVVEGAGELPDEMLSLSVEEHLAAVIASGADEKTAVKQVASARGLPKNDVYKLTVKDRKNGSES